MKQLRIIGKYEPSIERVLKTKYNCQICSKQFQLGKPFRIHLKEHQKEPEHDPEQKDTKQLGIVQYFCRYCNKAFHSKEWLRAHQNKHRRCNICDFRAYSNVNVVTQHMKKDHDTQCTLCDYNSTAEYVIKHMKKVHSIKAKEIKQKSNKCIQCGYKSKSKNTFKSHILEMHIKTDIPYIFHSQPDKTFYECTVCGEKQDDQAGIGRHVFISHQLKLNFPKIHKYKCSFCENKFNRRVLLARHLSDVHENKDMFYKCSACNSKFEDESGLARHHFTVHLKLRKTGHKCENCDFESRTQYLLKKHVTIKHEKRTSKDSKYKILSKKDADCFICLACGFKTPTNNYNSSQKIKDHLLVKHNHVEKPNKVYECTHCEFETGRAVFLAGHVKNVHGSDELFHTCNICNFKGLSKGILKQHNKAVHIRKPLECKKCDYKVKAKEMLIDHVMRVHEGLRHLCTSCSFTTPLKTTLEIHIRKYHTNIACKLCKYSFSGTNSLKIHHVNKHWIPKTTSQFNGRLKRIYCNLCSFKARFSSSLSKHLERTHKIFLSQEHPLYQNNPQISTAKDIVKIYTSGGKIYFVDKEDESSRHRQNINLEDIEEGEVI